MSKQNAQIHGAGIVLDPVSIKERVSTRPYEYETVGEVHSTEVSAQNGSHRVFLRWERFPNAHIALFSVGASKGLKSIGSLASGEGVTFETEPDAGMLRLYAGLFARLADLVEQEG